MLATLSFLGIITLSSEAKAASIKFGQWTLNKPIVTKSSSWAGGTGTAAPHTLKALAAASATLNPGSWSLENVTTIITLSNFFKVEAGKGEKQGDKVKGLLTGSLNGSLLGIGLDVAELTGSFNSTVEASVDAGFQSFSYSNSHSASVLFVDVSSKTVKVPINKTGTLTIGEEYPFNMSLTVSATKSGVYQAVSKFDTAGLTANVEVVPEPVTILGSGLGLGFGVLFKKKYSRKQKKSKNLNK